MSNYQTTEQLNTLVLESKELGHVSAELFTQVQKSAYKRLNKAYIPKEDIPSIAFIGVSRLLKAFDVAKGVNFGLYVYMNLTDEIRKHYRTRGMIKIPEAYRGKDKATELSYEAPTFVSPDSEDDNFWGSIANYSNNMEADLDFSNALAKLHPSIRKAIELDEEGYTYQEIADMLGYSSKQQINKQVLKAKNDMKNHLQIYIGTKCKKKD